VRTTWFNGEVECEIENPTKSDRDLPSSWMLYIPVQGLSLANASSWIALCLLIARIPSASLSREDDYHTAIKGFRWTRTFPASMSYSLIPRFIPECLFRVGDHHLLGPFQKPEYLDSQQIPTPPHLRSCISIALYHLQHTIRDEQDFLTRNSPPKSPSRVLGWYVSVHMIVVEPSGLQHLTFCSSKVCKS
jgi:hypothetical protein